jgi:hypothetical protein
MMRTTLAAAAAALSGCMAMPADPSKMSPEQLKALSADKNVSAVCAVLTTPWGPQRSALLSVDKTVLQNGAVAIDQDCKLQYIAQPPAKL